MFRIVSIAGFIITFVGIALHCVFFLPKLDDLFGKERRLRILDGLRVLVYLLTLLLPEQRFGVLDILRKLVYLLALICFCVLTINGFYPSLILGEHIAGYWLMLQVTVGGVFAACLAVLALMWAHRYRFNDPALTLMFSRQNWARTPSAKVGAGCEFGQKTTFWLIILLALPLILSIVLSMFTLFGTDGQEFLLQLHRYSALLFVLAAIVHAYLVILVRTRK